MTNMSVPHTSRQERLEGALELGDMENHLRLLAAFRDLRRQASASGEVPPPYGAQQEKPLPTSEQWTATLVKALVRFEAYLTKVLPRAPDFAAPKLTMDDLNIGEFEERKRAFHDVPDAFLPPVDVALIWPVYMLNPSRYYEDMYNVDSRYVLGYFRFPLGRSLDTPAARETWEMLTETPFDVFQWHTPSHAVGCPTCGAANDVAWSELSAGSWHTKCASCSSLVSSGTVLGKRWAADAARWTMGGSDVEGFRLRGGIISPFNSRVFQKDPFMPGLTRLFENKRETKLANHNLYDKPLWTTEQDIYGHIVQGTQDPMNFFARHQDVKEIGEAVLAETRTTIDWKHMAVQAESLRKELALRVALMMRCYTAAHPLSDASLDLVQAAIRQTHFLMDMEELGWLDAPKEADLGNARMRYYAWLGLAILNDDIIPTLDIDLAWHTHMLNPQYYAFTFRTLGHFLNHDDTVGAGTLEKEFARTEGYWEQVYKQPFSVQGGTKQKGILQKVFGKMTGKEHDAPVQNQHAPTARSKHSSYAGQPISGVSPTGRGSCIGGHSRKAYRGAGDNKMGYGVFAGGGWAEMHGT